MSLSRELVVFTDLDGCLLNKADYDYTPTLPVLAQLRERGVPVVLSSSKTLAEMQVIAATLGLSDQPLSSENGGLVFWPEPRPDGVEAETRLGADRNDILLKLEQLKSRFAFRSFRDLGYVGVQQATGLEMEQVVSACARHCTEPLLWDDAEDRLPEFQAELVEAGFTFTRGGRFWHVAGDSTKGAAMRLISGVLAGEGEELTTVAIGDSPIDQSMLDAADIPVGIPWADGSLNVTIPADGVVAAHHGASGWAEAVRRLIGSGRI